ncbi:MAG: gliding motility-associated C-terminal domain-containing protein [Saprospiraceae bacterium]|nr:gliding motility-associated C-terminal domain-containing protein [Saprospiraceae bacterium]
MTQSCFRKTGFWFILFSLYFSLPPGSLFAQPCSILDQTATLTSSDCAPASNPCTLCPGDMFSLNATGVDLQPGACVRWYYGATNTFNPYNGEGTLLGCAQIENIPPVQVPEFTATVTADMCNNGPYWVVGIIDPLTGPCSETFTNYIPFDVQCASPVLDSADICHSGGIFDLTQLQDPAFPTGTWSGDGVTGTSFNPVGLFGQNILTFTPTASCSIPSTTTVSVFPAPTATFNPVAPVCPGTTIDLMVTLSGQGPWTFDLLANNVLVNTFNAPASPFFISVSPMGNTDYTITNFQGSVCPGPDASVTVTLTDPPSAELSLIGPDTICGGNRDTLSIDFDGGMPPYIFYYSVNGIPQPADTTDVDPYVFLTPVLAKDTTIVRLDSVFANGCRAVVSGIDTITVLPFPSATLQSDTISLCLGQTDTLRIKFEGPGPYTFQYAANLDTMPPVTTTDTLIKIPITPPLGQTVYMLTHVQGDPCGGVFQGRVLVNVANVPTANLTGDTTICAGESTSLELHFTGDPPFVTNYTANGIAQPADTSLFNPRTILVNPDTTTVYQLTGVSSGGCAGMVSGQATVTVQPELSATISGGDQICQNGPGTTISIAFEGNGPYTFVYKAGNTAQLPITTNLNPYVINVNPQNGTIYELESVTNGTCTGTVSGFAIVAVFTPSTAELISDITVCDAADTTVMVDFTGSGPFVLVYKVDGLIQDTVQTFDDPYLIPASVTSTTVFELVSVESPGCMGNITGPASISIFVNYSPTFANVVLDCDLVAGTYIVDFDVMGATLPLTLTNGSGNFAGTHFTSNPIPFAQGYNFAFHDANNCGDVVVSGTNTCNCTTDAGGMDLVQLTACTSAAITATALGNAVLDPNDAIVYVLHTGSGASLGAILDVQNQPVFSFQPGPMTVGTTYFISAVAGDDDGMGGVDLNDPCLSVSVGTPVTWVAGPTATIDASFDICPGEQVLVPVTFTGQAPFTFTYNSNNNPTTVQALQNTFSISATLLTTTTIQAVAVENALCMGAATGQALVTVHSTPQITGIDIACAPDNLSYSIGFDVVNADSSTVMIGGSVTGNFDPVTGHFISNPIPAQTGYSAIVTDAWMCGLDSISGGANCSCVTSAGTMDQTPLLLCSGDTATSSLATAFFVAPGDTLLYVLVTNPSPGLWTILASSPNPTFTFDPGSMVAGTPYFIVALAGNVAPGGLDMNDPCLSYALGNRVTWQPQGNIQLGSDGTICQGDTVTLAVLFSGNPPFDFIYQIDGMDQPAVNSAGMQYLLPVSPAQTTTYSLLSGTSNGCPAIVDGSATVTVNAVPDILNPQTVCDLSTFTYTLEFSVSNGPAPNPVYTVNGLQGSFSDSVFTSVALPSGQNYSLILSTPDGCTAQLSGSFTCACTTDAGTLNPAGPLNVCLPDTITLQPGNDAVLAAGDSVQYILYQNPGSLPLGIISVNAAPQFVFQPGMQPGATYYIAAMAGTGLADGSVDLTDPCLSFSPGVPVVFRQPPTASLNGDTTICIGTNTVFKINFTGASPFQFVYAINGSQQSAVSAPQSSFTISTSNVQQDQVFTLISVQDAYCPGTVSGTYSVHIQQRPQAALIGNATICPGDSAVLRLQLSGASLYDVTVNGGPAPIQLSGVQNGASFTVAPAGTTNYTINSFVAQGNNCPATIGTGATVTVGPAPGVTATVSDFGGFNLSCPDAQDGAIVLTPTSGTTPFDATWSNGMKGLSLQNLQAGVYNVSITDGLGCTLTDSFTLVAPEGLNLKVQLQSPRCFGEQNGSIVLEDVQGGVGPFVVLLNDNQVQIADIFPVTISGLQAGDYTLAIADVNGCETSIDTSLAAPVLLSVDLGPDTLIYPGDSLLLHPIITSSGVDSFAWAPMAGLSTLMPFVQPFHTTVYTLWVQDSAGCQAEDAIRIVVQKESRVYVPNAFNPEAGSPNNILTVYTGPEVASVKIFRVYDRWGGLVFEGLNMTPNEPARGWNGQWNGKYVLPGVYLWVAELEYQDGTTEVKAGDVSVLR